MDVDCDGIDYKCKVKFAFFQPVLRRRVMNIAD